MVSEPACDDVPSSSRPRSSVPSASSDGTEAERFQHERMLREGTGKVTGVQPFCFGFQDKEMEMGYLKSVSLWRRPVLAVVMFFDIFCFFLRIGWHLAQYLYSNGTLERVNEVSRQLWNLVFVYLLVGVVNWRTKKYGASAPGQEEFLLSGIMAVAISNLLMSLEGDKQDYVVACMFLVSATTILKIRWWVGSLCMLIAVLTAFVLSKIYNQLHSEALAHICLAWMCGMMLAYQSDCLRREMFASQKAAESAHRKEMEEARARMEVERDLAAAQLLAAENSLQIAQQVSANEAKSEFMRVMCHEIRTPLNGCLASVEMLLDTALQDEQRVLACIVRVCGRILLSTVSNFLDFFKLEAGGDLDLVETEVDLPKLMNEVQGIIQAMVGSENQNIEIREPSLSNVPKVILGDVDRLRGIILNLYSNAAKFTRKGFIQMSAEIADQDIAPDPGPQYASVTLPSPVRATDIQESLKKRFMSNRPSMPSLPDASSPSLEPKQQWLLVQIRDSGMGISGAGLKSLFKEYAQGSAEEMRKPRTNAGTGLGLSICLKQVGALGGRIGAYSELGSGSIFWFTVPMKSMDPNSSRKRSMSVEELKETTSVLSAIPNSSIRCVEHAWLGGTTGSGDGSEGTRSSRLADESSWKETATGELKSSIPASLRGRRVMLVEDNLMNQVVAQKMLKSLGVECTTVSNGLEAIDVLLGRDEANKDSNDENDEASGAGAGGFGGSSDNENEVEGQGSAGGSRVGNMGKLNFDVILMDMLMPKMGGVEATKVLRARGVAIPIIALTANALESDCEECRLAGMDGFLSKPVLKGDLKDCLSNLIRGNAFPKDKDV